MITVACLGAGYFSRFHIDGWHRIEETQIVGVADQSLEQAVATGYPSFASLDEMLRATKPDLLDIVIPPHGHAKAIEAGCKAGVRAIICQKPFCTSISEARAMVSLAQAHDSTLIVHENFRFQPWYRSVKDLLDKKAIGQPLQATFRLRPGDGQGIDAYLDRQPYFRKMDRFLIHETGIHFLDVARFLFGDPNAAYADLRRCNSAIAGEDAGIVILDHADDLRVLIDGNRLLDHAATDLRRTMGETLIEGTEGTIAIFGDGSVSHRAFETVESRQVQPPTTSANFGGDCVYLLQRHVADALASGVEPENLASEYLSVIKTKDAIYRSSETQQKVSLL